MNALSPHLLDRGAAVLVVVDVQERLARVMPRRGAVVEACGLLMRSVGLMGMPLILTRQNPAGLGGLVPELVPHLSEEAVVVDKDAFCCLADRDFAAALRSIGRRQVVLAGMETHICVAQTALALLAAGYASHVVADATCSRRDVDHDHAVVRLASAGVEITTTESVLYELLGRSGTDEFRAVLALVKERDAVR